MNTTAASLIAASTAGVPLPSSPVAVLAEQMQPISFRQFAAVTGLTNSSLWDSVGALICGNLTLQLLVEDLICTETDISYSVLTQVFAASAFTLLIVTAVVGNLIVMWIIHSHKVMHHGFNYFLFNMAFADFLIALLNVGTSWTFNMYYDWWYGEFFCGVTSFFGVAPTCVSVFSMMAVSWDRCLAVVNPLRKRPLSNRRTLVIVVSIWILSSAISLPTAIYAGSTNVQSRNLYFTEISPIFYYTHATGHIVVKHLCYYNFHYKIEYDIFLLIAQYVLPLMVLSVTYARIAFAFRRRKSDMPLANSTHGIDHVRAKRKAVKMLALVVAIFMICWLPYHLYHSFLETMLSGVPVLHEFITTIYLGIYWLAMSSCAYNPIIYCYSNARFRIGFRYAFRWLPCVNCKVEEYELSELFPERIKSIAISMRGYRCGKEMNTKYSDCSLDSRTMYGKLYVKNTLNGGSNSSNNLLIKTQRSSSGTYGGIPTLGRSGERDDSKGASSQLLRTATPGGPTKDISLTELLKGQKRRKFTTGSILDHPVVHVTASAESD